MKNLLGKLKAKQPGNGQQVNWLTITEAAQKKIQGVIENEEMDIQGLRIAIEGRTATAFQYGLGLEVDPAPDDVILEFGAFKVFIDPDSATNLKGATVDYVEDLNASGFKIDNPNTPSWDNPKAQAIQQLIDQRINPAVASHGGRIDLLDVKEDTVYIHMSGGCQGCGMASATLKNGVENMIRQAFPEIQHIIDTTDHASGTNPYYTG